MLLALFTTAFAAVESVRMAEALWRVAEGDGSRLTDCARADTGEIRVVLELRPGERPRGPLPGVVEVEAPGLLQLRVDPAALPLLSALPGVERARLPYCASAKEVFSEGLAELDLSDWEAAGLDGAGVQIAVLDVGFFAYGSSAELPEGTVLVAGEVGSSAHGVAVAEVLHDIAPAAAISLYAFTTDVEYAARMTELAASGVDVVNASIGFDNVAAADGDSRFAQLVDALADERIVYVAAAGNEVGRYRIGALTDADGDGYVAIDGEDAVALDALFGGAEASLRWSEPFGAAAVDLDLEIWSDGALCDRSGEPQSGDGDPYERARCEASGALSARIRAPRGLPEGLQGWLYAPGGLDDGGTRAGTLTLPADARGAIAVAAYDVTSGERLPYSSCGPTEDGRLKPEIAAPSGVSTAALGGGGFGGSSAAAPHVAGLAALVRQERSRCDGAELAALLAERALDRGPEGPDTGWGAGALRAGEAPRRCGCAVGGVGVGPLGVGILLAFWRRTKGLLAPRPGIP